MKTISIELMDDHLPAEYADWWQQVMALFLKPGMAFEIRHWRDEPAIIQEAAALGRCSPKDSTAYEVSVKGVLDRTVIQTILAAQAPQEKERMTKFFTIRVEGVLSCEHYGAELYFFDPSDEVCRQLSAILAPIRQNFTFGEYRSGQN